MRRGETLLSVMATGLIAWFLLAPDEPHKAYPLNPAMPKIVDAPKTATLESLKMATVQLPAPPAPARAPLTPTSSAPPTPVREPVSVKSIAVRKPIEVKPLVALEPRRSAVDQSSISPSTNPMKVTNKPFAIKQTAIEIENEGRPLLKLLEFGKGPSIELAWPDRRTERAKLFRVFSKCYGMQLAIINRDGQVYRNVESRGQDWQPNTDRFSGFVRRSDEQAWGDEGEQINSVRARHGLQGGYAIRLFPRDTDALLLGGLSRLIGVRYAQSETIQASYQLSGNRVTIDRITADGIEVNGIIDLSHSLKPNCRI